MEDDVQKWQTVTENSNDYLERLRVPGGWLYRQWVYLPVMRDGCVTWDYGHAEVQGFTFVPEN